VAPRHHWDVIHFKANVLQIAWLESSSWELADKSTQDYREELFPYHAWWCLISVLAPDWWSVARKSSYWSPCSCLIEIRRPLTFYTVLLCLCAGPLSDNHWGAPPCNWLPKKRALVASLWQRWLGVNYINGTVFLRKKRAVILYNVPAPNRFSSDKLQKVSLIPPRKKLHIP